MDWISIKDELPEIPEELYSLMVLCSLDEEGEDPWVQYLMWDGDDFSDSICGYDGWERFPMDGITHWMYKPEPYKEG